MTEFAGPLATLRKIRDSKPVVAGERCEMCAQPISGQHSHVVNLDSRALLCTCRSCYLLFDHDQSTMAYRAVRDRYLSFPDFQLSQQQWDELAIPVGLAFFFHNSRLDRTIVCYPGPAGATESELPVAAWEAIIAANPSLTTVISDVEALLVQATKSGFSCFLVPIDACYELVGHMRQLWQGFDGGQQAHRQLDAFFAHLQQMSKPVGSMGSQA